MKYVLVACECSQVVTAAFRSHGFAAFSCDIVPCYGGHPEWHIIGDAAKVVKGNSSFVTMAGASIYVDKWSMIVAHPPCTMLAHVSAVAYSKGLHTDNDIEHARRFFMQMLNAPCDMVAVENPAPMARAALPRYNQIVNPYDFGHPFSKRICLWLRGLPPLLPTSARIVNHVSWHDHCAGTSRRRSHFWSGIADAMAIQWGGLL